ncbi:MAG: type II secretion system protein [Patescibacteria group bacterium]|nr:MAG: type II secretion system protein [Patescibacteria group bacterium]
MFNLIRAFKESCYKRRKDASAFTLIELLVVIAIIGVLTTVSVIYFNNSRMNSRDAKRVSDIQQVQLALKNYYADHGEYPQNLNFGGSLSSGATNYILRVPTNPTPRTDNNCPDEEYQYKVLEGGQRYSLTFCLSNKTADLVYSGKKTATANGILDCEPGYIPVVGSAEFNTNDFCVMQYEAKCLGVGSGGGGGGGFGEDPIDPGGDGTGHNDQENPCLDNGGVVASAPQGEPIVKLTQTKAKEYCESAGGHLITNPEWMTIARDAETIADNWVFEQIDVGGLKQGNAWGEGLLNGFDAEGSEYAQRTLWLSSGHKIWDLSGNASELVDESCFSGEGEGLYRPTGNEQLWTNFNIETDYERRMTGPYYNGTGNDYIHGGFYYGCSINGNTFLRGGSILSPAAGFRPYPGAFSLYLDFKLDIEDIDLISIADVISFRCVK